MTHRAEAKESLTAGMPPWQALLVSVSTSGRPAIAAIPA